MWLEAWLHVLSEDDLRQSLIAVAAQWAAGQVNAIRVVEAAADAVAEGLDSPSLVLLAGLTRGEADDGVPDLLPAAMSELQLPYFGFDQAESRALAAAAI